MGIPSNVVSKFPISKAGDDLRCKGYKPTCQDIHTDGEDTNYPRLQFCKSFADLVPFDFLFHRANFGAQGEAERVSYFVLDSSLILLKSIDSNELLVFTQEVVLHWRVWEKDVQHRGIDRTDENLENQIIILTCCSLGVPHHCDDRADGVQRCLTNPHQESQSH